MKKKRKERWDGLEFLVKGWIEFNKKFPECLPDAMWAYDDALSYCAKGDH